MYLKFHTLLHEESANRHIEPNPFLNYLCGRAPPQGYRVHYSRGPHRGNLDRGRGPLITTYIVVCTWYYIWQTVA